MRILGVGLWNIRSFAAGTVVFDPNGVNLLVGENGSGKTTVFMAVRFALFGLRRGQAGVFEEFEAPSKEGLLRAGAGAGRARVLFEVGGSYYMVERNLGRQGDMGGVIYSCSYTDQGLGCSPAKRLSATELTGEVAAVLGLPRVGAGGQAREPGELFALASYSPQFLAHAALEGGDRLRAIDALLGVARLVEAVEEAKRLAGSGEIERLRTGDTTVLGALVVQLRRQAEEAKRELEGYDEEAAKGELSELEEELKALEARVSELEEEAEEARKRAEELAAREAELSAARARAEEARKRAGELGKRREELLKALQNLLGDQGAAEALEALSKKRAELEASLRSAQEAAAATEKAHREALKRHIEASKEAELVAEEIKRYKELANKGICPVCRQRVDPGHVEGLVRGLTERLEEARERAEKALEEARALEEELERLRERAQKAQEELLRVSGAAAGLAELARVEEELSRLSGASDPASVAAELEGVSRARRKAMERASELSKRLADARARLAAASARKGELERLLSELARKRERLRTLEEDYRRKAELYRLVGKGLREVFSRAAEIHRARASALIRDEAARFFNAMFPGLQLVLGEDMVPRVQAAGQPVRQPSGAEQVALALSFRLAVNKAVREMNPALRGLPLILDEPTYGFSGDRVKDLVEALRAILAGEGVQVIIATHDDELEAIADHIVEVSRPPGGTTRVSYRAPEGREPLSLDYIEEVSQALRA